ncbi:MAG: hypothetical protein RL318_588 [Fibrobacterota bacterium]|jgi:uncharacterized protein (TIGR02147 family)
MGVQRPSIYTYFDYRLFMRDLQTCIKADRPVFTLEHLARKVGLKSKGHMSLILKGAKNIPSEKIPLYTAALELDGKEADFFGLMVHFNQAGTHRDRKKYLDRMVSLLRVTDRKLVPSQYALCEKWYHPVVHELLRVNDIQQDWAQLGALLKPAITAEEAKESVLLLQEIGLVSPDAQGFFKPTNVAITFGEGWRSVAVREFQKHTFDLAQNALENTAVEERDISSLTLSLGESTFREISERISLFRKEILALARSEKNADQVFQLNFSLFPLSERKA